MSQASLQDIDEGNVRDFLRRARNERRLEVLADIPVEQVLRQLNLIHDGRITIAAMLLFGKDPARLMAQSSLRCARFKDDDTVHFLDMKVIEGTVIDQVEEAMAFVKRNISMAAEVKDLEREERWEYPLDAIREAITNAVCHRDYADTGNVQVRVFDHSLEVWNPGELPEGLTVEDLRRSHESRPRNKLIARVFFLIRYIEQFGTGTGRMIEECRKAGLPEPEFESRTGNFRIVFRKTLLLDQRFAGLDLNQRQRAGLRYIEKNKRITKQEYMRLTSATDVTAKRDLTDLVGKGVLVRQGATRNLWYEPADLRGHQTTPK